MFAALYSVSRTPTGAPAALGAPPGEESFPSLRVSFLNEPSADRVARGPSAPPATFLPLVVPLSPVMPVSAHVPAVSAFSHGHRAPLSPDAVSLHPSGDEFSPPYVDQRIQYRLFLVFPLPL